MTVLITLTTAGADTGPFNLYSNVDGYVTPFESSVAKSALLAGYVSILVPDGTTIIRVRSQGECPNYIDIVIGGTTTTTTTTLVCNEYELPGGESGYTYNFTNCLGNPQTVVVPAGDQYGECALGFPGGPAILVGPCTPTTTTTTTTVATPTSWVLIDCINGFPYSIPYNPAFGVGEVYQFSSGDGPHCGTIAYSDSGTPDSTLSSPLQRSCDDSVHCPQPV